MKKCKTEVDDVDVLEDIIDDGSDISDEDTHVNEEASQADLTDTDTLPEIDPIYESDTSDEETENTIGNIPIEWYNEYDHIGYDVRGKKIMRPASSDEMDQFINRMDDPNAWKSVFNKLEGKNVVLSKAELDIIQRIQQRKFPEASFDPYPNTVEYFTSKTEIHPINSAPEPKRRFIPSKWEAQRIMKLVRVIRKGFLDSQEKKTTQKPKYYDIWGEETKTLQDNPMHIPAPKLALPGNEHSYNPPEEYVPDEEERQVLEHRKIEEKSLVIPKKYACLRHVPAYERFVEERFERCLDLYLCPRMIKKKIQVDPESLIPTLPDPKDLQPFPSHLAITYHGHTNKVRSISIDPLGKWLASGSDDATVKVWELATGRLLKTYTFSDAISVVAWNPNSSVHLLSVAVEDYVYMIHPLLESEHVGLKTESVFHVTPESVSSYCQWKKPTPEQQEQGYRSVLRLNQTVSYMSWHRKGDYFTTLTTDQSASAVLIHQLSKMATQNPFKKTPGLVQRVLFHPTKPLFFIATQRYIRIYNLMEQKLQQKLASGVKWISSMDIHPGGDHVVMGSFDRRVCWFDTDLSLKPYRTLRYHKGGIRQVVFHKRYPLFASCSDDKTVNIFHGMVYNDLMQNPLIVPLKSIKAHDAETELGVLACEFHPTQPWIVTSGADHLIKLFTS